MIEYPNFPEFEKRRLPYFLALPAMWLLAKYVKEKKKFFQRRYNKPPRINTLWFDGLGLSPRRVKEGKASWSALDEIYNYQFGVRRGLDRIFSDFWQGMMNCQAVRNRFKIVKKEIKDALQKFAGHQEVRILSLACGSAQPVIEVVSELLAQNFPPRIKSRLLDISETALTHSMGLAEKHGIQEHFTTTKSNVVFVSKVSRDFKPHIIEMVGLLDYLTFEQSVRLFKTIYQVLPPGGIFITCNICPNLEQEFLRWVVDWDMIYKTPDQMQEIMTRSGFVNHRLVVEPLEIHCLAIGQK